MASVYERYLKIRIIYPRSIDTLVRAVGNLAVFSIVLFKERFPLENKYTANVLKTLKQLTILVKMSNLTRFILCKRGKLSQNP